MDIDYMDRFWTFSDAGPLSAGVSVRLLSPQGTYPEGGFRDKDAAVIVTPDLCAVVTRFAGISVPDDYYSEIAFASPFDVRVLGAVMLAWTMKYGVPRLYPTTDAWSWPSEADLRDSISLERLANDFLSHLSRESIVVPTHHRPRALGGHPYELTREQIDYARVPGLFSAIDINDRLLIRGIGALLQANMLANYYEFFEQACMSLWVSMEASMHLIFRRLKGQGIPHPTAQDAGEYLDSVFENQGQSSGYFSDYYSDRIRTVHPSSSFGVYHLAPLAADDFYDLNESLVPLYDFIVSGNVREELRGY
jgi:hypothetical protein